MSLSLTYRNGRAESWIQEAYHRSGSLIIYWSCGSDWIILHMSLLVKHSRSSRKRRQRQRFKNWKHARIIWDIIMVLDWSGCSAPGVRSTGGASLRSLGPHDIVGFHRIESSGTTALVRYSSLRFKLNNSLVHDTAASMWAARDATSSVRRVDGRVQSGTRAPCLLGFPCLTCMVRRISSVRPGRSRDASTLLTVICIRWRDIHHKSARSWY
jgi:hypothetical protein